MKNNINTPNTSAASKRAGKARRGMYTAVVSALVIAIVIVFNLVLGSLPNGSLEFDMTDRNIYSVTQQSVDYLKTLDKDISIVVLAQPSAIDERISKFINNYAKLSPRISLKIIDPVLNPTALTTYNTETNTVVVSCSDTDKTRILNLLGVEGLQDGMILYDAQTYYSSQQLKPISLDAEGQLTSAVNFVTSETTNTMHLLSGHGEAELGTNAASLIAKGNIETASLNLLTQGGIPDGCELILCYNPTLDLADDELDMLLTYLRTGGNLLILLDNTELNNFNTLLATYGLQIQNGVISDSERYYKAFAQQYGYFCIYPALSESSEITSAVTSDAIFRYARGMLEVTPQRRGTVVTPFMTTSENGILAVNDTTSTDGQYLLGATAIETFVDKTDNESRLTVITAIDLISADISMFANLSNFTIFMNAVTSNYGQVQNLTIPAKSLSVSINTIAHPGFWSLVFIGVLPLGLLSGGLVVWVRRRNR